MNFRTLLIAALAATTITAVAAGPKKKTTKAAATAAPAAKQAEPVSAQTLSYALGVAQAPSLVQYLEQREGVDTLYLAEVARALDEASTATPEQMKRMIAYAAGLKIAQMNAETVVPQLNKAFTAAGEADVLETPLYVKGLTDYLTHQNTLSADSAMALANQQSEYISQTMKQRNAEYLAENAKKSGVKTTASGLQYRVITQGTGAVASDTTSVDVHYEGRLIDGTVFDSSYQRGKPATFTPKQVIKGWTEALQMMPEGSTWELTIPYNLAYGERGTQNIPPFSTLIFKVEVVKVH